jgi:RecJ-like exonuclease
MVKCPRCEGKGRKDIDASWNYEGKAICGNCKGTGKVPESLELQVKRLKKMIEWLADNDSCELKPENGDWYPAACANKNCYDCRIKAAFDAAEKEK